jgi:hypothetical protein
MISAREFCREPGYPVTLFLTYSFSPLFFERVCLADLEMGGSRRIVIAADAEQVSEAMVSCVGQLVHLGRRYVLAETAGTRTFHPKLIARLSPTGGRVWIGSGNLTYTGWGGNRELATAWSIGPGEEDSGAWLDDLLSGIGPFIGSAAFATQVELIRNTTPWLRVRTAPPQTSNVLFGSPDRPLAPQLAERWRDRRFANLMLCTGSTDTDGAFLAWAHRTFGIERATVCLSPAHASFDPVRLSKLPLEIRIVKAAPEKVMHAKFYWFSGRGGNGAVFGSANCSAAAWLAGRGAGNTELVAVYDDVKTSDFKSVLEIFAGPKLTPAQALTAPRPIDDEPDIEAASSYRIVSLRLRSTGLIIEAVIEPAITSAAQVSLILSAASATVRIPLALHGSKLSGRLPPNFEIGSVTPFACVELIHEGARYITKARWLDNEAALERSSREEVTDPNLRDLARPGFFNTEHQKIMEAVYAVSAQLLSEDDESSLDLPASHDASCSGSRPTQKQDGEDTAHAVDPVAIVRSLKDLKSERQSRHKGQSSIYGGTLDGVMAQLFSRDEQDGVDLSREAWSGEAKNDPEPATEPEPNSNPSVPAATPTDTIMRFYEQIDYFIGELGRLHFAQNCDAKRMVQALAFPLLLCVRGTEAGWLPKRVCASIAARVVDIMLNRSYGRDLPQGLLHQIKSRYAALGKMDEFLHTVGDGTLWATLIASLATMESGPLRYVIRYSVAIQSVFECRELLAITDAEQLSALVPGLIIKDAEFALTNRAPGIAEAMFSLTKNLTERWDAIYREQGKGRNPERAGSVLWAPNWGWKILPDSPAQTYCTGYINVESAAIRHEAIRDCVDALMKVSTVTIPHVE